MKEGCDLPFALRLSLSTCKGAGGLSGRYSRKSGFIHCSKVEQVLAVANRLFVGESSLLLLEIDPEKLSAELKYEDGGDGDGEFYPHLYGPLELEAVVRVFELTRDSEGLFQLPQILTV